MPQISLMHQQTGGGGSEGEQRVTRLTCFPYTAYLLAPEQVQTVHATQDRIVLCVYSIIMVKREHLVSRGEKDKMEEKNFM